MPDRSLVVVAALNMAIAIGAGAFGAHGLKRLLTPDMLAIWHTAVTYHVMHAIGMILVALLLARYNESLLAWAGWIMFAGIILFSGSLYWLALSGHKILGAITPIGGVAFILAWLLTAWAALRAQ